MNLLKWLKDKTGKMPITLTQAVGITAVVGAAGFAAMNFLSTPNDNNNTFIPPSVYEQSGDVVYITQGGGGGQYEANGEIGSTFKAAPSRSIQLANQQAERERQARALEESASRPMYADEEAGGQMPKAYQFGPGEVSLAGGGTMDKQLNASLETFSTLQNRLSGVSDAVNNAQANATAAGNAGKQTAASGQSAGKLASASRNWGNGGLTHAGGGSSGSSNSFVIQDSGKNTSDKEAAAALAQAGNVMADARAAITKMQEGTRLSGSRARFGSSEGLGPDKDVTAQADRRISKGKTELAWLRKQAAEINRNPTNSANEAGRPFLASTRISGGLTVNGENVTTGQGASSGDLSGTADRQLKGVSARVGTTAQDLLKRTKDRHDLRKWMWIAFPTALVAFPLIARLRLVARVLKSNPFTATLGWIMDALALVVFLLAMIPVIKLLTASISYLNQWKGDGVAIFSTTLSAVLAAGLTASFLIPGIGGALSKVTNWVMMAAGAGIGLGGATAFDFLSRHGEGEMESFDEGTPERPKELEEDK